MQKTKVIFFFILSFHFSNAQWNIQTIENTPSFRAMDIFDANNIWISGSKGHIMKSADGGKTWGNFCPEKYKNLDFRGVDIISKDEIIAMSAGDASEDKALVIKTNDGGKTWTEVLKKAEKGIFFDTIKFKDNKTGYVLSDPIDSKPYLLKTIDGGNSWKRVENLPEIMVGESSFAASNSCISIFGKNIWFNSQNRNFHSKNDGKTWEVLDTPFETGKSRGIFGTFFIDNKNGFIVGGDFVDDKNPTLQYAVSNNAGKLWLTKTSYLLNGLTECISRINGSNYISVGTIGTALSKDKGQTWTSSDKNSFHVVKCVENNCYAAGGNGKVGVWHLD